MDTLRYLEKNWQEVLLFETRVTRLLKNTKDHSDKCQNTEYEGPCHTCERFQCLKKSASWLRLSCQYFPLVRTFKWRKIIKLLRVMAASPHPRRVVHHLTPGVSNIYVTHPNIHHTIQSVANYSNPPVTAHIIQSLVLITLLLTYSVQHQRPPNYI